MAGFAERLSSRIRYDVFRKSILYNTSLMVPKCVMGNHVILDYSK